MSPFEAYELFTALKLHFNSDYDFVKYNGKTRVSETTFDTRRDKYQYVKLSKHKNPKLYVIANMFLDPRVWVGNLKDEPYKERKGVWDSLEHTIKSDLDRYDSLDEAFVPYEDNYPPLYSDFRRNKAAPETLIICDMVCNIFKYWDDEIGESDVLWFTDRKRLKKLGSFLAIDRDKYYGLMVDIQT